MTAMVLSRIYKRQSNYENKLSSNRSIQSDLNNRDDPSPAKGKVAEGRMGLVGPSKKLKQRASTKKANATHSLFQN
jgi:hypothetical protein